MACEIPIGAGLRVELSPFHLFNFGAKDRRQSFHDGGKIMVVRRRLFTLASLLSLLIWAATAVFWVRSYWLWDRYDWQVVTRSGGLASVRGVLAVTFIKSRSRDAHFNWNHDSGDAIQSVEQTLRGPEYHHALGVAWGSYPEFTFIGIPHFLAMIVLIIPMAVHLISHSRGIQANHCPTCSYDLTGNMSGVCPECGAAIEQKVEAGA